MRADTVLRLAVAGNRTDTLRVVLTAAAAFLAALALLAAATVLGVVLVERPQNPFSNGQDWLRYTQYANDILVHPLSRAGLALALLLFAVALLALAAQSIRLGTPDRDRRLAAIRLAGASPAQAVLIAAAETGLAGLVGTVPALALYLVLRSVLHRPDANGQLPWPTDVRLSPVVLVAVVVGLPVLAGTFGTLLMRRVIVTPLGVVRRSRTRPPRIWVGLLITGGIVVVSFVRPLSEWIIHTGGELHLVPMELVVAFVVLLGIVGLVAVTGWISYATGRLLRRFGRGPAALLAGSRLIIDPWYASRTGAALLAAVIFGAAALAYRSRTVTSFRVLAEFPTDPLAVHIDGDIFYGVDEAFYRTVLDAGDRAVSLGIAIAAAGILIALAEGIAARRRTYVSLVAAGVPRTVLARAIAWQTLAPLMVSLIGALVVGNSLMRLIAGPQVSYWTPVATRCPVPNTSCQIPSIGYTRAVPVPLDDLLWLGLGTLAVMLVVVGLGAVVLRMSTDVRELRTA